MNICECCKEQFEPESTEHAADGRYCLNCLVMPGLRKMFEDEYGIVKKENVKHPVCKSPIP